MAALEFTATCEMDLLDDAIRSLSYAMGSLGCRHGAKYRDYEARLETMLNNPIGEVTFVHLEPLRIIAVPPQEWRAMVTEGRSLGVI